MASVYQVKQTIQDSYSSIVFYSTFLVVFLFGGGGGGGGGECCRFNANEIMGIHYSYT